MGTTASAPELATSGGGVPIRVDRVCKVYETRGEPVEALREVSIDVAPGEFVSFLGPSGCGKSTLMLMIAGLISHTRGDIEIAGAAVDGPHTDLGIVFQDPVLLDNRKVLGNLLLRSEIRDRRHKAAHADRARDLLRLVGLEGFEDRYPFELSGGMRQRVAICRALLHDPPLLLMDEPFGALDALTRDQLNADVLDIWARSSKTVVFVTHSITEAVYMSDRVVVMSPRPGRIEEILEIDLPRPRPLSIRETPQFGRYTAEIRRIFNSLGVIRHA